MPVALGARVLAMCAVVFLMLALPGRALDVGSRVKANQALNVRSTAAGTVVGARVAGDAGRITSGPVTASLGGVSYVWWQVDWDTGVDGWSFAGGLDESLLYGIDVSHFQGTINWTSVAAAGKTFAIAKATESTTITDANFTQNMTNGRAAGVTMGAYHFARPSTSPTLTGDALAEARAFVKVLHPWLAQGGLWPVLDLEDGSSLGKTSLSLWTRTFCNEVKRLTTVPCFLYTSRNYAQNYLESSLATLPLWIAVPNTTPGEKTFDLGPWTDWTLQQYSWTGIVAGISGAVDLDAFAGDETDLAAFVLPPMTHTITAATISRPAVVRGNAVTLTATVDSTVARTLLLGASFFPAGTTTGGVSDGPNDAPVNLVAGSGTAVRQFAIPSTLAAGVYDLWLAFYTDLDGSGTINSGDLAVGTTYKKLSALTVYTTPNFATWAAAAGLSGADAAATADPDGDGQKNLAEYAFGTQPLGPQSLQRVQVSAVPVPGQAAQMRVQFPRYSDRADLTYTVERSASLTSWTPLASATGGQPFTGAGLTESGSNPVTVTLTTAPFPTGPTWLRVRVTKN